MSEEPIHYVRVEESSTGGLVLSISKDDVYDSLGIEQVSDTRTDSRSVSADTAVARARSERQRQRTPSSSRAARGMERRDNSLLTYRGQGPVTGGDERYLRPLVN